MKMSKQRLQSHEAQALPKLCGADIELGNFIAGLDLAGGTGYEASGALLEEIEGLPIRKDSYSYNSWSTAITPVRAGTGNMAVVPAGVSGWSYNPQDRSRRFLASNGSSAYIDLNHAELCLPETRSAFDHLAGWHAQLAITRCALDRANGDRHEERKIHVLVNNSDGLGHSYGSHLNFLINRQTFENIFWRKPHHLQFLASFQGSSVLLTGQGKVGSENGQPYAPYQLSQRADFFETLQGVQTTYNRPIVNARDEALCGRREPGRQSDPARLHVIFFDSALAHGSCLFRVGPMQLILTLMELGMVNSRLILDDPLAATLSYSHDPNLKAVAKVITGQRFTALELQSAFLDEVKRHASRGAFVGLVSDFEDIIALWEDTLNKFGEGDLMALAPRLDWVMKLMAIERAIGDNPGLDWDSPEIKMIDQIYSSLGDDGLYRAYESSGFAEQLVPRERIEYFTENPPEDTRAWTRAMLLRRALSDHVEVDNVDWDRITFKMRGRYAWPCYRTFEMANPLGLTRAEAEPVFASCPDFGDLLDGLESIATEAEDPSDVAAVN